jgi:hypothetical protein
VEQAERAAYFLCLMRCGNRVQGAGVVNIGEQPPPCAIAVSIAYFTGIIIDRVKKSKAGISLIRTMTNRMKIIKTGSGL